MTSKLREYEFNDPVFGLFILWVLAHSLTYTNIKLHQIDALVSQDIYLFIWLRECTSRTISRKRLSISLIQNKNLDFIRPCMLSIETSQEMEAFSNFKMGTLAFGINCNLCHPPAHQFCKLKWNKTTMLYKRTTQQLRAVIYSPNNSSSILKMKT